MDDLETVNIKYLGANLITSERFGAQDGNLSTFPAMLNSAGSQCVLGLNLGVEWGRRHDCTKFATSAGGSIPDHASTILSEPVLTQCVL
jgi:hypothetical protein